MVIALIDYASWLSSPNGFVSAVVSSLMVRCRMLSLTFTAAQVAETNAAITGLVHIVGYGPSHTDKWAGVVHTPQSAIE